MINSLAYTSRLQIEMELRECKMKRRLKKKEKKQLLEEKNKMLERLLNIFPGQVGNGIWRRNAKFAATLHL